MQLPSMIFLTLGPTSFLVFCLWFPHPSIYPFILSNNHFPSISFVPFCFSLCVYLCSSLHRSLPHSFPLRHSADCCIKTVYKERPLNLLFIDTSSSLDAAVTGFVKMVVADAGEAWWMSRISRAIQSAE